MLDVGDVEGFLAAVLVDLAELLVVDYQQDLLLAKLAQLHALLDEISLSLALGVVPVDVILDQAVSLLGSSGFGIRWHGWVGLVSGLMVFMYLFEGTLLKDNYNLSYRRKDN